MTTEVLGMRGGGESDAPRPHSTLDVPPSRGGAGPDGPAPALSLSDANKALRKIAEHELAIKRIKESAREQREEIDYWEKQECAQHERAILEERIPLEAFTQAETAANPLGRKSVVLASGIVGYGPSSRALVVEDEGALMEWLRQWRPEWLRHPSPVVDKKAIKESAVADEDGVLRVQELDRLARPGRDLELEIPGVRLVKNPGDFYVSTGAGGKRAWSVPR